MSVKASDWIHQLESCGDITRDNQALLAMHVTTVRLSGAVLAGLLKIRAVTISSTEAFGGKGSHKPYRDRLALKVKEKGNILGSLVSAMRDMIGRRQISVARLVDMRFDSWS